MYPDALNLLISKLRNNVFIDVGAPIFERCKTIGASVFFALVPGIGELFDGSLGRWDKFTACHFGELFFFVVDSIFVSTKCFS